MPKLSPQIVNYSLLAMVAAFLVVMLTMVYGADAESQRATSKAEQASSEVDVVRSDLKAHLARQEQFEVRVLESLDEIKAELKRP